MNSNEEHDKAEKVSPINPLLNILGNAVQSSIKYNQTSSGLETKTCKSCGAARPAETDLKTCDYCGFQFY
jgi:hypothetical protein